MRSSSASAPTHRQVAPKVQEEISTFRIRSLADVDHAIAEAYGVWGEKVMWGRKYMGRAAHDRSSIDRARTRSRRVFEKVNPAGSRGREGGGSRRGAWK